MSELSNDSILSMSMILYKYLRISRTLLNFDNSKKKELNCMISKHLRFTDRSI